MNDAGWTGRYDCLFTSPYLFESPRALLVKVPRGRASATAETSGDAQGEGGEADGSSRAATNSVAVALQTIVMMATACKLR